MRKVSLNCGGNAVVIIKFGFEYIILFMASIRIGIWHRKSESREREKEIGRGKNEIHFIGFPDAEHTTQQNRANRELR